MPAKIKHLEGRYKAISFRLVQKCDDAELRLYLFLKFHAIEKHDCFPSMDSIIENLGWSRPKLSRTIERMEKAKRLKVTRSHRVSNVYDITWYDAENELGFIHTFRNLEERNVTQLRNETLPKPVTKRSSNYKELTTRNKQQDERPVDKSTFRTGRGMEPISAVMKNRKP